MGTSRPALHVVYGRHFIRGKSVLKQCYTRVLPPCATALLLLFDVCVRSMPHCIVWSLWLSERAGWGFRVCVLLRSHLFVSPDFPLPAIAVVHYTTDQSWWVRDHPCHHSKRPESPLHAALFGRWS